MAGKFIQIVNSIFGDKQKKEVTPPKNNANEEVKEQAPTSTDNKETISFDEIKSVFSFKKKPGVVVNTKTTVTSTTTTTNTNSAEVKVHEPVNQLQEEHYEVRTTNSGLQYEEKQILLKATDINLTYGGEWKDGHLVGGKVILRNVNMEIRDIVRPNMQQGQIVSIIGQSGMGKTQLFKILAGLHEIPKTKSERVKGREITGQVLIGRELKDVQAGDVGVITQDYLMLNHRTVRSNFQRAISKNHTVKGKDANDLINMYVDKFNLSEQLDKYPLQLSGGQRQRAAIVQQLLPGGDFILFDEPFSGLDIKMIKKTLAVLKSVSVESEDRTLIIVSHDIATSCSISDHVFILGLEGDIPGATIKKKIDLMERDLAWHDENTIKKNPVFIQTIEEIESLI